VVRLLISERKAREHFRFQRRIHQFLRDDQLIDLGLGWLMGHRVLLLTLRGRRSGRIYQTAREVIRYDPASEERIVPSAWRDKADWYRNIKANPAMEIQTGRERYVPTQRFLSPEETHAELAAYKRRYPWLSRTLPRWLGFRLDDSVRMVAFRPARE
jgi:deazaflavin-dependent oxidoreductase (nitroreductase family)